MINENDIIEDPKNDEVGALLVAVQAIPGWTKERHQRKRSLVEKLTQLNYQSFEANKLDFGLKGVGESILYQVPINKTGHLKSFRGQLVRVVCANRGKRDHIMMVGKYTYQSSNT